MKIENIFNGMGFAARFGKLGSIIKSLSDGKVDREDGKGLSSNDFTDEYKAYLDSVMSSGETGGAS